MGHLLFAYRYLEVAEMFSREDKSEAKHIKNRKITGWIRNIIVGSLAVVAITFVILTNPQEIATNKFQAKPTKTVLEF
jgi:hypothetical protein